MSEVIIGALRRTRERCRACGRPHALRQRFQRELPQRRIFKSRHAEPTRHASVDECLAGMFGSQRIAEKSATQGARRQSRQLLWPKLTSFTSVPIEWCVAAARRSDPSHLRELEAVRPERFALMDGLAKLPDDMVFFTQITMEAAEDPAFLQAMARARIRGALV
ncbi:MAG TPA: hypothetical protein VMO26_13875, partial [Vicinamibacterales bacterium]|nr:hypothetical protein [Vicinamibacterales bacterium]